MLIDLARQAEFTLGIATVRPATREFIVAGQAEVLEPRVMQTLVVLAHEAGEVVSRDTLVELAWDGRIVGEDALNRVVSRLRKLSERDAGRAFRLDTIIKVGYRLTPEVSALALPSKPSVAVLPFTNLSAGDDQDYFADGMVVELVSTLSLFQSLFVISSGSTLSYRGDSRSPNTIARELGVRYILQGNVRKAGDQVRIAVELLDEVALAPIWAQRFDGTLDDIFALQDSVSHAVASQIEPTITASEVRRAAAQPTQSNSAYDLYLRGTQAYWELWTKDSLSRAADLFERAAALDPSFALAQAYASSALINYVLQGHADDPAPIMKRSLQYAHAGLSAGQNDAEVVSLAAYTLFQCEEPQAGIDELIAHTLAVNPGMSRCHYTAGYVNMYACRPEAALQAYDVALRLDPRTPWRDAIMIGRAQALFQLGRYQDALPIYARAEIVFPAVAGAIRRIVAISHAEMGDLERARALPGAVGPITANEEFLISRYRDPAFRKKLRDAIDLLNAVEHV